MDTLDENFLSGSSMTFRVNEVVKFLNLTPRILKHYETTGVLKPARENENDYRKYTAEDVIKIHVAEQLKTLGFTSREIGDYFSGRLDIEDAYNKLMEIRERLNRLIDVIRLDICPDEHIFSFTDETKDLCFVKEYPSTGDIRQKYFFARETYSLAVKSGCVCKPGEVFFILTRNAISGNKTVDRPTIDICLPISKAPKKPSGGGRVEEIVRKKSFMIKSAGHANSVTGLYALLTAEAERRGLTLDGNTWAVSETGPNKKTAGHTYTIVAAAEIKED